MKNNNNIYSKVNKIRNEKRKTTAIESYEKINKLHEELIYRGLTKKRGYSLSTIADKPYEYKGNDNQVS